MFKTFSSSLDFVGISFKGFNLPQNDSEKFWNITSNGDTVLGKLWKEKRKTI